MKCEISIKILNNDNESMNQSSKNWFTEIDSLKWFTEMNQLANSKVAFEYFPAT